MKLILLFLTLSFMVSCSSKDKVSDYEKPQLSDSQFNKLVKSYTFHEEGYSGFDNDFNLTATLLNSKINMAIVDRVRYHKQLNPNEALKSHGVTCQIWAVVS